ncbi:MAG: sensor histidine kinase [Steroidobacteraceae bacterium]
MNAESVNQSVPPDPELAWRVLGLLNLFRLLVPIVLGIQFTLLPEQGGLGAVAPTVFTWSLGLIWIGGIGFIAMLKLRRPDLSLQAYVHACFDVTVIALLLAASGGADSGLGLIFILPIGAISLLLPQRHAAFIAGYAAVLVLSQETWLQLSSEGASGDFPRAGLLGLLLLVVSATVAGIANRLRRSEAQVRQRDVDLANLAELSQFVVEKLRESVVVVDVEDRIRLINESARQILGVSGDMRGRLLGEASPRLLYLLETWRNGVSRGEETSGTLIGADGAREIRPTFAPLGPRIPCPTIVFLQDLSEQTERARQTKLAALGRLSASIAHEIRNPVGAMSHAAQLLAESPDRQVDDQRLIEIIGGNAARISQIVENVMQLSVGREVHSERMPLREWLENFLAEGLGGGELPEGRIGLEQPEDDLEIRADPSQLRQILRNLVENACHFGLDTADKRVELRSGRMAGSGRPFVEVLDRGPGVPEEQRERVFEPFFTTRQGGTGLGLFISRELAQGIAAMMTYEPRPGGGSIFRIVFADPARWE